MKWPATPRPLFTIQILRAACRGNVALGSRYYAYRLRAWLEMN
jgi:hypothetical protein